eukprot:365358-Chlamydomonas_euryale.AAC.2
MHSIRILGARRPPRRDSKEGKETNERQFVSCHAHTLHTAFHNMQPTRCMTAATLRGIPVQTSCTHRTGHEPPGAARLTCLATGPASMVLPPTALFTPPQRTATGNCPGQSSHQTTSASHRPLHPTPTHRNRRRPGVQLALDLAVAICGAEPVVARERRAVAGLAVGDLDVGQVPAALARCKRCGDAQTRVSTNSPSCQL